MKTSREERIKLLHSELHKLGKGSVNDIINSIYHRDLMTLSTQELLRRGWRYYNHLNKFFSKMERDGLIINTGLTKVGELGKLEKIWTTKH
jgi:hypothetical protein